MTLFHTGSLAFRFLASILGTTLVVLAIAMTLLLLEARGSSEAQTQIARQALGVERQESERLQSDALATKAELLGRFMARIAPDLLLTYDLELLGRYEREAATDPDIAYAVFLDPDDDPIVAAPTKLDGAIERRYPVEVDGETLGTILIGLDPRGLAAAKEVAGKRIATAIEDTNRLGNASQRRFLITLAGVFLGLLTLLGVLFSAMFLRQVIRPINVTAALIGELAQGEGDLSLRLPVRGDSEIDRLRLAVNCFMQKLQDMVRTIVGDTQTLTQVATTLSQVATGLVNDMDSERSHTHEVTTGVDQMATTIRQVAISTIQAAEAAGAGEAKARAGQDVVQGTTHAIDGLSAEVRAAAEVIGRLEEASGRIVTVLDAIGVISSRTNLLALNAAIEAARAGQHGRGFAVVADEVRSLAVRTQESTLEVREILDQVRIGTQEAIAAMERGLSQADASVTQSAEANAALGAILQSVRTISAMTSEIATAADEQAKVAEIVSDKISVIDHLSRKTSASATEAQQTSLNLTALAEDLMALVGRFRV